MDTIDQLDLIDTYRTFLIQKQQNTHPFQVHMEHSPGQIIHWLWNKSYKTQRTAITSSTFQTKYSETKIDHRKKNVKRTDTWRLNKRQNQNGSKKNS